jgi:hypothetical protein
MLIIDRNLEIPLLVGQRETLSNEVMLKNMGKMKYRFVRIVFQQWIRLIIESNTIFKQIEARIGCEG